MPYEQPLPRRAGNVFNFYGYCLYPFNYVAIKKLSVAKILRIYL